MATNNAQVPAELQALFAKQDKAKAIEDEIRALQETLENMPGKPGLKGPLIDKDGFPRADVDIYKAREHRHRIACLQTDHKAVMKEVEQGLYAYHQSVKTSGGSSSHMPMPAQPRPPPTIPAAPVAAAAKAPFALIDDVSPASPALAAGLKVGHRVLSIGTIDADIIRDRGMSALGEVVAAHEGRQLEVQVLPEGEARPLTLQLTPARWSGRGLLGCHLQPLN